MESQLQNPEIGNNHENISTHDSMFDWTTLNIEILFQSDA